MQSDSQSTRCGIFPTVGYKGVLGPRLAYAGFSLGTLSGFDVSKRSHSLQTHYQSKMQRAFLFVEPILDINMHGCLVVTQLSRLENKGPSPIYNIAFKVKGTNKDTGRFIGHLYIHETTTTKVFGDNSCSVANQPRLHSGRHLRWPRLLKEAWQSEVMLEFLRQPQNRMN